MSGPATRVEIVFHGRVQGVGFRATVAGIARDMPISGWVRNEPDGTVRMQAQGTRGDVDRFVGLIESRMGRLITTRSVQDLSPRDERGFAITH